MTAIIVLQMYSILLKELCLLENKSMINALGILARRNRKTLAIWPRGNRGYDYYYVSEKNMKCFPNARNLPDQRNIAILLLTNTKTHGNFKSIEIDIKKIMDY